MSYFEVIIFVLTTLANCYNLNKLGYIYYFHSCQSYSRRKSILFGIQKSQIQSNATNSWRQILKTGS